MMEVRVSTKEEFIQYARKVEEQFFADQEGKETVSISLSPWVCESCGYKDRSPASMWDHDCKH